MKQNFPRFIWNQFHFHWECLDEVLFRLALCQLSKNWRRPRFTSFISRLPWMQHLRQRSVQVVFTGALKTVLTWQWDPPRWDYDFYEFRFSLFAETSFSLSVYPPTRSNRVAFREKGRSDTKLSAWCYVTAGPPSSLVRTCRATSLTIM